jgi:hypothetical protein
LPLSNAGLSDAACAADTVDFDALILATGARCLRGARRRRHYGRAHRSAGKLRQSLREGFGPTEVNRLKAFTRCGMGRCQGRFYGLAAAELRLSPGRCRHFRGGEP